MGNCDSILVDKPKKKNKTSPINEDAPEANGQEDSDNLSEDESDEGIFNRNINPKYIDNADELGDDTGLAVRSAADMNEEEAEMLGMATKAWKGSIFAPDNAPDFNPEEPNENLSIEWVYGYCGHLRQVLGVNNDNKLVYPSASISIVYDENNHSQRYSKGNNDDISAFARNPNNKNIFATGQVATIVNRRATLPHISVFNTSEDAQEEEPKILKSVLLKRSVRCLGFDKSGKYLACVGDDNEYTVLVFEWETGTMVASKKSGTSRIYGLEWNPSKENEFATIGKNVVLYWTLEDGVLKSKRGLFGSFKRRTFYGIDYSPKGKSLLGSIYGELYIFDNGSCKISKKIHAGAIYCITNDGNENIITGGKDGYVRIINSKLEIIQEHKFEDKVRSLTFENGTLYVGLTSGIKKCEDIMNLSSHTEIMKSHSNGELWAITNSNTNNDLFLTAGEDNQIIVWDSNTHKAVYKSIISDKQGVRYKRRRAGTTSTEHENKCCRGLAVSPDNNHIALGLNSGELNIYNYNSESSEISLHKSLNLNKYSKRNVINQHSNWIEAISYSPNGKFLAIGSHGISIIFLDVENDYKMLHVSKIHNSAITHLDWSKDSQHIQSNCRGYELIFHDINEDGSNIKHNPNPSELNNVEWATQTCILGWPVQSIYDSDQDGTDVNKVAINDSKTLIATGDDKGKVTLFRYPVTDDASSKKYGGHCSHVMNVIFNKNNDKLFSVGGNDRTIIQWKIE